MSASLAERPGEFVTFYAEKRWGHGRLSQLATQIVCRLLGHDFAPPIEGIQRCRKGCGGMQRG